jgi:hypothetical protein
MKTLNEASVGSGENTPLIGSSPVVGTILKIVNEINGLLRVRIFKRGLA